VAGGLVVLALLFAGGGYLLFAGGHRARADLVTHKVRREKLQLTIVERGQLEAAENKDVICQVKARTTASTLATTIRWVIDDGTEVKKGEKLAELDDSGLQSELDKQNTTVEKAKADKEQAEGEYEIVQSQSASDIASAELALEIAKINLDQYVKGDYLKDKKDIEGRMEMAKSDLEMWEERAAWSARMSQPGRRYVTASQAQADHARMVSAKLALAKVEEEMRVLENYTKEAKVKDLQGKVDEAERALKRTKIQTRAKEAKAKSALTTAKAVYDQELNRQKELKGEIEKCKMYAPQDGLVVYYVPEQTRMGGGSRQSIIAQGEPVMEGQKLIRIPDLSKMVVNTKVHEAMVSRLKAGQKAVARVDAFPERALRAHIKSVATVASQQDWFSSDVKVYQTMVSIDEHLPGLKPGMTAEVTIFTDSHSDHALTVPIQAILGGADLGSKRKVYVLTPNGPEPRDVEVGISNEKMAEILSGVEEGEEVILNPRVLLSDKERAQLGPERRGNGNGQGYEQGGQPKEGGPPGAGGPGAGGPPGKDAGPGKGALPGGGKGAWPKDGKGNFPKGPGGPGGPPKGPGGPPKGPGAGAPPPGGGGQ
jgi:HlyD family secretion protein